MSDEATVDVPLTLTEIRALMASPDDINEAFPWDDGYGEPLTLDQVEAAHQTACEKLHRSASTLA